MAVSMIVLNSSIVYGLAHLDVMVVELLLFLEKVFFIFLDSELLLNIFSIDGWVSFDFMFGFFYHSLSHFIFSQIFIVLVFDVHLEYRVDNIFNAGPFVGKDL